MAALRSTGPPGNSNLCSTLMVSLCHDTTYIHVLQISNFGSSDRSIRDHLDHLDCY